MNALASEIGLFNRRLEDFLSREAPRRLEERKETWVLLSALGVVVTFCLAAFYLNQVEMRELKGGIEDGLDQAVLSAASSVERTLAGLHLDRLGESQAALERFLRERDERDGQRLASLLAAVTDHSTRGASHLEQALGGIEEQRMGLQKLVQEVQGLKLEFLKTLGVGSPERTEPRSPSWVRQELEPGWAARGPDGAPKTPPPDPAVGLPRPELKAPFITNGALQTPEERTVSKILPP